MQNVEFAIVTFVTEVLYKCHKTIQTGLQRMKPREFKQSAAEVIKHFSCSAELRLKFILLKKVK